MAQVGGHGIDKVLILIFQQECWMYFIKKIWTIVLYSLTECAQLCMFPQTQTSQVTDIECGMV